MADSLLKSAVQGRIAAALVGIGAAYLANRYGFQLSPEDQSLANEAVGQIIGSLGAWASSAVSLGLAFLSKLKDFDRQ